MAKNPTKQQRKRKTPEEIVAILADKHHRSERFVQMVISGERNHEEIFTEYITYKEEHNLLLKAVKKAVPFN